MAAPLVGIVNHDHDYLRLANEGLTEAGFRTLVLLEGSNPYQTLIQERPDLVILDTWLATRDAGWTLLQLLKLDPITKNTPVLVCTSDLEALQMRAHALENHGTVSVLNKPYTRDALIASVEKILGSQAGPQTAELSPI